MSQTHEDAGVARFEFQADVVDHLPLRAGIGEGHVPEFDRVSRAVGDLAGLGQSGDDRAFFVHEEDQVVDEQSPLVD